MADQVIPQQHGRLVAAQVVDRRPLAAQFRLIQHIIMHQRRHVNHLDDGRNREMNIVDRPARTTRQQHEHRSKHLAPKPRDVFGERADAGQIAARFVIESPGDFGELGLHSCDKKIERAVHPNFIPCRLSTGTQD